MSSKRTVLSRPRTKLYDANYNIGESYYKPALDRLDRKYSGRPMSPSRYQAPATGNILYVSLEYLHPNLTFHK